jgi:hypothetical protein
MMWVCLPWGRNVIYLEPCGLLLEWFMIKPITLRIVYI